jgi:flavin-dependent dehydrogenase
MPSIAERMKQAKLITEVYAAANFSYRRETMSGEGYLMVGDAFAFIDPMFSSGVHLALNSAMMGADVVEAYLRDSPEYRPRRREFDRTVRRGIDTFSWFIHRFTQPAFRDLFMSTRKPLKMEQAVLSLLAGDVFTQSRARLPLFYFKVAYYLTYVLNWKQNRAVARRRRQGLQTTVTNLKDYAVNHET